MNLELNMQRSLSTALFVLMIVPAVEAAAPDPANLRGGDPLTVGSEWQGTLTQDGQIQGNVVFPKFDARLRITRRDDRTLEGELHETAPQFDVTYVVKGDVTPARAPGTWVVTFKSTGVKDSKFPVTFITGVQYAAEIRDTSARGTWLYDDGMIGIKVSGEFRLERK
jgi:hypothetical protein